MGTLKIGILGTGNMAGGHARILAHMEGVEVTALCDVTEEITRSFQERNLAEADTPPEHYTDPAELFAKAGLDAVVIVTPHTMHFDHGMQALASGCHVFMEKPMVTSTDQARQLRDKVKQTDLTLVIGYNTPCSPEFAYLRDVIRNGTLGKLELVHGFISQNWLNATTGTWRQKPELSGGGQAYDSGAHLLNSLVWTLESSVEELFAMVDNHGSPVDINSAFTARFECGVITNITIGGNCPSMGSHMVFMFDQGRIEVDGWNASWMKVFDQNGLIKYPRVDAPRQNPIENFIQAIRGEMAPCTSPDDGVRQSELMDAFYASAQSGQPVRPQELETTGA